MNDKARSSEKDSKEKTVKLKYTGPAGQVVQGFPVEGGLQEGRSYEVPKEIGESLVKYSAFWEKA